MANEYEIDPLTGRAKKKPKNPRPAKAEPVEVLPPIPSVRISRPDAPRVAQPTVQRMFAPEPEFDIATTMDDLVKPTLAPEPSAAPLARTAEGSRTGLLDLAELVDALYSGKFPPLTKNVKRGQSGKPVEYSREIADRIVVLATKLTLKALCKLHVDMPSDGLVRVWILDNVDGFAERWNRARKIFLQGLVDEVIEISDDDKADAAKSNVSVQRSKLRVENRIWLLTKLNRELFGSPAEADPAKQNAGAGGKENVSDGRQRLADLINRHAPDRATNEGSRATH